MIGIGLSALWSHWHRHWMQLATLILGLALATALWSGVQAINAEARASYDNAAETLGETRFTQLLPTDGETLPMTHFVQLRRDGWRVSPVVEGTVRLGARAYRMIGFDPFTAPQRFAPAASETEAATTGAPATAFFTPPYQILAHPDDAARIAPHTEAEVLEAEGLAPGTLITDLAAAQAWLDQVGRASRLMLVPGAAPGATPLSEIAPSLEIRGPGEGSDISRLTRSFHLNLTAFGLLSFAVGLFIVHGTIGLAFEQRRGLFRTLRALGMPVRILIAALLLELLIIAVVAGSLGMALGYAIAAALLPDVAATLRGLYGASVDGTLSLRPAWWAAGMLIALLGTGLAAAGAIAKVVQLPLLAPAQPRAWSRLSERNLILLTVAALGLAVVAGLALQLSGLVAGFTFLGALLIAAALTLPVLVFGALRLGQALARRPVAQWFWADTRQQLPGLSLALMALLLALATNIGVSTMVSSFRLTFTGYLDQRLSSELYVTAETQAQATALRAFAEARADAVLPIWSVEARVLGLPAEIYGIVDHATYRENWPMLQSLPRVWDDLAEGRGLLINEQLSRRAGLAPGDVLDLPGGWRMPIAGVYSDYGNATGQVIVALPALETRFPDLDRRRFGMRTEDPERLARVLVDAFGLRPDQMIDQASIKAFSLQVFERTFTVTAALNVLTLSVAGFAMLTSLLTLSGMRQPQLAPVWALGLTRRRLAALELLRAVVLALLTVAAAVPVGLALAWSLLAVINVEAFGWRLPMFVFPGTWLGLGAAALLAAVLAALWPAWRLARTPPSALLQVFSYAR